MHLAQKGVSGLLSTVLLIAACQEPLDPEDPEFGKGGGSKLEAPSGTDAVPTWSDQVWVSWTDNSTGEGSFRVERSIDGGTSWATAAVLPLNSMSFADEGRTVEQRVCYRVIATMGKGSGAASAPSLADCTAPPATPTELTATAISAHAVDLVWQDNSRVEDGYYLTRLTGQNPGSETPVAELPVDATSYHDTGLLSGTGYGYRLRAKKDGGFGGFSNVASATTPAGPPLPPSDADAVALGGGMVRVGWKDNSTEEDGFRLERAATADGPWESVGTTFANAREAYDYNRPVEQAACYRLLAFNKSGDSEPSNVDCAVTPAGPTQLAASPNNETAVDLTWFDNSAVEDGYEVERNYVVVATLGPNAASYHDQGLLSNETYYYRVRARKQDGFSSYSGQVIAVTASTSPNPPASPWAAPASSSTVVVSWWDNSSNEEGYRVERSLDGGTTWPSLATTGLETTWFTDEGRESEREVCYRVLSYNRKGDSDPASTNCTAPPLAPDNLGGSLLADGTLKLEWEDRSAVEDGYEVWLSTPEDFFPIASVPRDSKTAQVPFYGYGFSYAVAAARDGGHSDFACCIWGDGLSTLQTSATPSLQGRMIREKEKLLKRILTNRRRQ